jgi:hypothetical protein
MDQSSTGVIVVADRALDLGNVGRRHVERRSSESRVDTFALSPSPRGSPLARRPAGKSCRFVATCLRDHVELLKEFILCFSV